MKNIPTLQQLIDPPSLNRTETLALRVAAGLSKAHIRSPKVWKTLYGLELIDKDRNLTPYGSMQFSNNKS